MQYNEDEKKCIRIIAKWFRENKELISRSEAMKALGVDDAKYEVLIKVMEHNGVVENVRSELGKGGYAIAFKPSVYAEELAREFGAEDVRQTEGDDNGKGASVRKVIEEAARDGRELLNLRHWEIESLPAEIGNLSELRELLLDDNHLRALPAEIGKLANLERLEVSRNRLTELPIELGRLANMQELYVSDNLLKRIPAELGELKKLRSLELDENPLESPPAEVVAQGMEAVLVYLREQLRTQSEGDGGKAPAANNYSAEQYEMLKRCSEEDNIAEWNRWREEHPHDEVRLQGAQMAGWNLKGANLRKADLRAYLPDVNLEGADLREANLWYAYMPRANLRNALLQDAILGSAHIEDVESEGAIWGDSKAEMGSPKDLEGPKRRADVVGNVATIQIEGIGEKDRLGRDKLVKTLAGMFAQTECNNGFTMALLGDWGQGKSTVMGLLQTELEEKHRDKFEFAKYNAWEYEKADNVAAGIAQEVVAGLLDISGWKMPFLRARFAWREHKSSVYLLVLSLVAGIALSLAMMFSLPLIELAQSVSDKFPNAKTFVALVTTYWPGILPLLGLRNVLKKTEHPLKVGLRTYFRLPDYGEHLGLVPVLKKDIVALCELQLNELRIPLTRVTYRRQKKLIVFVDDLDRCNVDHIVKVLDAIRLVMTIPSVIVMIGIDHRIAFRAIGKHYEELADGDDTRGAGEIARDYLGKIIQLPLRLRAASHGELKDYVFEGLFDEKSLVDDSRHGEGSGREGSAERPLEISVYDGPSVSDGIKVGLETDKAVPDAAGGPQVTEEEISEAIKDTKSERNAFYELAGKFEFSNPRQLLRLHNSFRFLKGYDRAKGEGYDTLDILAMLFWQEFLHNWPIKVRGSCMAELIGETRGEGVKPTVKKALDKVRGDIAELFNGGNYAELAEFVRIVVLPHNEEGIFDTEEEIREWPRKKEKERSEN